MKLEGFKRILTEDLPAESRQLADKLASTLNPFAEQVITALNGRLNITDNINQVYKELTIDLNSDGTPKVQTAFKSDLIGRCKGIDIQYLENVTNVNTYPTAAPFITWVDNNSIIIIKHVTGLQANNKWKMRLLLKGD